MTELEILFFYKSYTTQKISLSQIHIKQPHANSLGKLMGRNPLSFLLVWSPTENKQKSIST